MDIYRVYLTSYRGNLLPPFYIGSTSQKRLNSGYRGSVKSARYRETWNTELANNPRLFKTVAVGREYSSREDALAAERRLQVQLNVVKSTMYVNQSIAARNGCFGRDVAGELHPLYGKRHSVDARRKISENHADVSGAANGRARTFKFISPTGDEHVVEGGFKKFCRAVGLPYGSALFMKQKRVFSSGPCKGWQVEYLD